VPSSDLAVDAVCARLRGEPVAASGAMIEAARHHRVHLLMADSLSPDEQHETPASAALVAALRTAAIVDAVRERELRRLLAVLSRAGIEALLLKGAGLAYTVYASPHLRPRADLDLLIAPEGRADADRLLTGDGWTRAAEPVFMLGAAQQHYERRTAGAPTEHLDLHWKISNARVFGDAIGFDELLARAVPVPVLGAGARTLSGVDALFVACVHRVAHHEDALDLLWLWDIHLLASRLSPVEIERFIQLAADKRMRSVCARGLALAGECFHTPGAGRLVAALQRGRSDGEPSARFVGGGLRMVDVVRADLEATPTWHARARLVCEHVFPARAYMRSAYARWPAALLPLAYAHRIVRGAPKWFRRPGLR
jgi:hypothetical protein